MQLGFPPTPFIIAAKEEYPPNLTVMLLVIMFPQKGPLAGLLPLGS